MAKKKPKKKQSQDMPENIPISMEQMMQDISRLLSGGEFDSIEDMNQFLNEQFASGQLVGQLGPVGPQSDLERAQDMIYQAHEAHSKPQMVKLVRAALNISLDCADAYVLLAQLNAQTLGEKWALYEAGVKAGERALGSEFEELKGHFWGFIETRPYMRARLGLAMTLWEMGRVDEAAQHMDAMLELNPGDNQGVRYLYITLLLEKNETTRLEKLFEDYPDDWSATWKYSQALYEFRKAGRGGKADELLLDAISFNPHVPPYILGKKKLPKTHNIAYYSPGDENEALEYLSDGIRPWRSTDGAIEWLKAVMAERDKGD